MMFLSHVLFGFLSGFFVCEFLGCSNQWLFIGLATVASSFPDIDHLNSKISRHFKPFAIVTTFFFSHRGFIHSLLPAFALYVILIKVDSLIATAVLVGYVSHLLLDATTTRGIRPFYPLKIKVAGFIKTNSFVEKIVSLLLFITIVIILSFS